MSKVACPSLPPAPHNTGTADVPAARVDEALASARTRLQIDHVFASSSLPALRVVYLDQHSVPVPVPIPSPPARCPDYLIEIRRYPCLNCQAPPRSESHHEGDRGVGQRCSDFLTVPACPACHDVYTDTGAFPGRTREESLRMMQVAQIYHLQRWAEQQEAQRAAQSEKLADVIVLHQEAA